MKFTYEINKLIKKPVQFQKINLAVMLLILVAALILHFKFGSIFVVLSGVNSDILFLFEQDSLKWLSSIILVSLIFTIITYSVRFYYNNELVNVLKGFIDLIVLWFIFSYPYVINTEVLNKVPNLDWLFPLFKIIYISMAALIIMGIVRSSIIIALQKHKINDRKRYEK